jgi:hypothetical protein
MKFNVQSRGYALLYLNIKWLTMGFFKREDSLRWEMTEKRPRVLKNIFNYFIAILYSY